MGGGDAHKTPEGRIFVGGHWRDEQEWPLARTMPTPYYLHADGLLSPNEPAQDKPIAYQFDPRNPVPTLGGNVSSQGTLMFQGAADQRCRLDFWLCSDTKPLSARNDVLVFETPPLANDIEVTGRLIIKLWASSNALDTDFTAKLVDVYPPKESLTKAVFEAFQINLRQRCVPGARSRLSGSDFCPESVFSALSRHTKLPKGPAACGACKG